MMGINSNMAKDEGTKNEMGWLYNTPQVDREQYLLGKKIDRQIDPLLASEDREKQALASGPGALFIGSSSAGTTADIATKIKEDPLFLIKKKEEEARKQLASNPVKMKQLQQLLAKEKSSKHKSKKKKKMRDRSPHKSHSPSKKSKISEKRSPLPQSSPPHRHSRSHHSSRQTSHSRLSREELEKRRSEMMADAESHGRDREQRLRRLEHEHRHEEETSQKHHDKDFLQSLRVQSMSAASSVEDRIHRNISSVQRTHAALDKNFLRK